MRAAIKRLQVLPGLSVFHRHRFKLRIVASTGIFPLHPLLSLISAFARVCPTEPQMSAKKLPRSGSRNRVVRAGGVLSIGGLSSDSCGSKKKQLSMTRLELEGEEEGLKVSVDDAGTAAEVVYEEEIFEECLDDEEDRPAETVEEERIRRRMGSGRRNRGIPLAANVGESINYDCSAQLTERGGADGLEADINDVSLVHFPAPAADEGRREWAPEKKPKSEDIVDKILAEDGAVRKKVRGEQRSSSECQENDGISSTDFPTAGQMVQGVSLGEGATSKYAILGGRGGGRGEEAEEERGEGGGGREGSGAEGGSNGGSSGGSSGGRGGGKAPLEKKVKGPVSGGPYSSSGKADSGNRGWGDRGGSKPAAGEKSGKKKTGENKENRGAGSSSSLLAQPEAEGKTEKKLVVKPGANETAAEAAEAAVAHRARTVDSPVPRRSQVSGEASAQMGVCEEESIEGMPPKPKSTELRADVATFACRLGLGGRETESLRGVDIGDKEAAAMVHGLRKNRDIQLLDLSDSSIRGEAAELFSSVLGSAAVPVPK